MPDVSVQLYFGSEERNEVAGDAAYLSLANCRLRVKYEDGELAELFPGDKVEFTLRYRTSSGELNEDTLMFNVGASFKGKTYWNSKPKRGRRLHGITAEEHFCMFSRRPEKLSVELLADPHDFRLHRPEKDSTTPASEASREDVVDKVVALLCRIGVLGEENACGECVLGRKELLK